MQPTERNRQLKKTRYDVLSIPGYVNKKDPSHGARHGPTMRQKIYHKAYDMLKEVQKEQCSTILQKWYKHDLYRGSLSAIGWNEEALMAYDKIAVEDHSCTATREKKVGTRTHGNSHETPRVQMDHEITALTLKMSKRHANDCTMKIQRLLNAETHQFLLSNKSDKRPNQQFEGHEKKIVSTCFIRTEISCSRDYAFVFIYVIMVTTERQLVVTCNWDSS